MSKVEHRASQRAGEVLGSYKLREKLGEGGNGQVFLATRVDGAFEKQVAVKVLRDRIPSQLERERLVQERQILASLEHPCIAGLLDGGTTPDGLPYFVMELVFGKPITAFCDHRRLPVQRRLELFLSVCQAVAHAHQSLIVHRDLKPSNILVNEEGMVKVLDFGIAKIVGPLQDRPPDRTATGDRVFTPGYASPEQIFGDRITTATDTYALGVLLFELLTGGLPFQRTGVSLEQLVEQARLDAPRPSSVAENTDDKTLAARDTTARELCRTLRGDLDTILGKALRAQASERYASIADLAGDVRSFLDRRPILARPPSVAYRSTMWLRRNPVMAVATTLIVLATLSVATVSTVQSWRVARQQQVAETARRAEAEQRQRAELVTRFLVDMLADGNPTAGGSPLVDVASLLDTATRRAQLELADDPQTQATLLSTIASVHQGLGQLDAALDLAKEALVLGRESGGNRLASARSWHQIAAIQRDRGEIEAAEESLRTALLEYYAAGVRSPMLQSLRSDLAVAATPGDVDLTVESALFEPEASGEPDPREILALFVTAGTISREAGRYSAGLELLTQALELAKSMERAPSLELAARWTDVATLQLDTRQAPAAKASYREALRQYAQLGDGARPELAATHTNLSLVLLELGELEQAEKEAQEAVQLHDALYGQEHYLYAVALSNLGQVMVHRQRFDEAKRLHHRAREIQSKVLGPGHPKVADQWNNLAIIHQFEGDFTAAERAFRSSLELRRTALGTEHPATTQTMINLAHLLRSAGGGAEASRLYHEAASILRRLHGTDHPEYARVLNGLAVRHLELGEYPEAERLSRQVVAVYRATFGQESWRTAIAEARLGVALAGQGKLATAKELLEPSLATLRAVQQTVYLVRLEKHLRRALAAHDPSAETFGDLFGPPISEQVGEE
ncbi:MAG: serine/threonine-protein kinase [Acidobacteriota bacterium]